MWDGFVQYASCVRNILCYTISVATPKAQRRVSLHIRCIYIIIYMCGCRGVNRVSEFPQRQQLNLTDIARELSISKTTVSRALSGNGRVSEQTRQRILNHIEERSRQGAGEVTQAKKRRSSVIGVVLPSDPSVPDTPFFFDCLMGVSETATLSGCGVLLLTDTGNSYEFFRRMVLLGEIDGLIFTRTVADTQLVDFLKERKFPFVVTGSQPDKDVVQVDADVAASCEELTKIILSSCSRVAFVAGNQSNPVQALRYEGFIRGFMDFERFVDKSLVFLGADGYEQIDSAMNLIMQRGADCVIASDDVICLKLLHWMNSHNYSIPGDIRVASFYNSSYIAHNDPPITAIRIKPKDIGTKAAKLLMDMMEGQNYKGRNSMTYEILIRKSTL